MIHENVLKSWFSKLKWVGKLDIDKLEKVPTALKSLKSKVDKIDVDKLVPVPVDLSKLSDAAKNDVRKDQYNTKIKNIEDKILDYWY